jgi:predicted O-methyltransferase YrrM
VWLGLAARKSGAVHITSIDHSADYARKTQSLIDRHGLQDTVEVLHCPLAPVEGSDVPWYDLEAALEAIPAVGLLFVDGPPAADDPMSRKPAFKALQAKLKDGSLIALDDVDRDGEAEILAAWTSSTQLREVDRIGRTALLEYNLQSPRPSHDPSDLR